MRDRLVNHLQRSGRSLSADELLRECLDIHSPNSATAEKLLAAILGSDPRVIHRGRFWRFNSGARAKEPSAFRRPAALYLERSSSGSALDNLRGALVSGTSGLIWQFDLSKEHGLPDVAGLRRWVSSEEPDVVVTWNESDPRLWRGLLSKWGLEPLSTPTVPVRVLADRLLGPLPRGAGLEDLSALLELAPPALDEPASVAGFLNACFQVLLARVPPSHALNIDSLRAWICEARQKVDLSRYQFGEEFLRRLPESPGVYVMRDRAGGIQYVGKSRNLRARVRSYFTPSAGKNKKVARVQERVHSLEVIVTSNEVEALLLEMRLIRDFHPPINLQSEVHEKRHRYGAGRNLILLVAESNKAIGYLIREGTFAGKQMMILGRGVPSRFRDRIRSVHYSSLSKQGRSREAWEAEIMNRWIAGHRRRVNYVDVDEAGDFENAIRCLNAYLKDPDKLSHKVIYR